MYLSCLKLNPSRRTTRELRLNPYRLHQAVFHAFPDVEDGGPGRVLYRLDTDRLGSLSLLVQSEKRPDWSKAELLADCLGELLPPKQFTPIFQPGQTLYFCLRANPIAKRATPDKPEVTRRFGLIGEEEQLKWLERKAVSGGFKVVSCRATDEGKIKNIQKHNGHELTHLAIRFEGVLQVVNAELFAETINSGIGPAKGFGFGLLSLAPVKD